MSHNKQSNKQFQHNHNNNIKRKEEDWHFDDIQEQSPSPPGFVVAADVVSTKGKRKTEVNEKELAELKQKKSWDLAKSPFSSIITTFVFFWMMPSGVNIFTFGFLFYSIYSPVIQILSVSSAFARFKDKSHSLLPQQLVYIALCMVPLYMALSRCYNMGLLPNETDWASYLPVKNVVEIASGTYF